MTERERLPQEGRFHTEELRPGVLSFLAVALCAIVGAIAGILAIQSLTGTTSSQTPGMNNWLFVLTTMLLTWLLVLPLAQYLLLRFVGGARPGLAWAAFVPHVFGYVRAVGHLFERRTFALVCAVPFFVGWILFPLLATLIPGGWETGAPLVGGAMGVSVYFLRYSTLALSKPEGTLVEELAEEGSVKFHEPVRNESPRGTS